MHCSSILKRISILGVVYCLLVLAACRLTPATRLFRTLTTKESGIDFVNAVEETPELNILNFHYIYNGGGVGVADFNGDGLPDLVFSGNQVSSRIYLNEGDLHFKDVTAAAAFQTEAWTTGVSIVDINADGLPDIYLSVGGFDCTNACHNELYVHQGLDGEGTPRFREMARDYGLADGRYTQQAAFFDYDNDGDQDVYLLHNAIDERDKNAPSDQRFISRLSKDQLLENRDGRFVDVSAERGIDHPGYGLGITIDDFNDDRLPDLYIANDFLSNDLLYLNRGMAAGIPLGFEEVGHKLLKHTSYNAMGVDVQQFPV